MILYIYLQDEPSQLPVQLSQLPEQLPSQLPEQDLPQPENSLFPDSGSSLSHEVNIDGPKRLIPKMGNAPFAVFLMNSLLD